jgi:predicted DNA-binding transcriptional regulator AlpA
MPAPENAAVCQKLTEISQISSRLFTIREFCSACRISLRQFYRLQEQGEGPKMTWLGGRKLITRSALDRWLWEHEED